MKKIKKGPLSGVPFKPAAVHDERHRKNIVKYTEYSGGVILPAGYLRMLGWAPGDPVFVCLDLTGQKIVIEKAKE